MLQLLASKLQLLTDQQMVPNSIGTSAALHGMQFDHFQQSPEIATASFVLFYMHATVVENSDSDT